MGTGNRPETSDNERWDLAGTRRSTSQMTSTTKHVCLFSTTFTFVRYKFNYHQLGQHDIETKVLQSDMSEYETIFVVYPHLGKA